VPIETRCENPDCKKVLRVKDELAGKRAKCPGCGQVFTIKPISAAAAKPTAPAKPAASKPTPPAQDDQELWQWMSNSLEQSPPKPLAPVESPSAGAALPAAKTAAEKKKKPKKKGPGALATEFNVLGMQTTLPGLVAKLAFLGLLIWGGLYGMGVFDSPVRVALVERVDALSAASLAAEGSKGADVTDRFSLGGTSRLLVVQKSLEGGYFLVRVQISQSLLSNGSTANNAWAIDVKSEQIAAKSGGQDVPLLMLVRELSSEDRRLEFDMPTPIAIDDWSDNLQKVGPAAKSGIGPEQIELKSNGDGTNSKTYYRLDEIDEAVASGGELWNHPGHLQGRRKFRALTRLDGKLISRDVNAQINFKGAHGMEVKFEVQDKLASASWDKASHGWISANVLYAKDEMLRKYLELVCLLPRPSSGELTLTVAGVTVAVREP
jgi:hypothetical protein